LQCRVYKPNSGDKTGPRLLDYVLLIYKQWFLATFSGHIFQFISILLGGSPMESLIIFNFVSTRWPLAWNCSFLDDVLLNQAVK
jgi:hypothetical protein